MNARQLIITAGALAALAAPAAQARPMPDDGGAPQARQLAYVAFATDFGRGTAQAPAARAVEASGLRYQAMAKAYDEQAAVRALGLRYQAMARAYDTQATGDSVSRAAGNAFPYSSSPAPASTRPDDRGGIHGAGPVEPTPSVSTGNDVDWTWVAAGSSSGLVLLLAGGALLLAVRRHSRTALSS